MACLAPFFAVADELDCENAMTTREVTQCMAEEASQARNEMERYLAKSMERHSQDEELVEAIRQAQEAWRGYMDAHCGSVYVKWRDGTVRNTMALKCRKALIRQRTHEIWKRFLIFPDSTPALLPEPEPEREPEPEPER